MNAIEGITFRVDGTDTAASPGFSFDPDNDTGIFSIVNNTLSFSTGGTERLRIGTSGEILIGGTAAGTSGQVFTSAGPSAPPTWETPSGGGGGGAGIPQVGEWTGSDGDYNQFNPGAIYSTDVDIESLSATGLYMIPFVSPLSSAVTEFTIRPFATASTQPQAAIYSSTTAGLPDTKQVSAAFGTASGVITQTTLTGSLSLVKGTLYWLAFLYADTSQNYYTNNIGASGANVGLFPVSNNGAMGQNRNQFLWFDSTETSLPTTITTTDFLIGDNSNDFPSVRIGV